MNKFAIAMVLISLIFLAVACSTSKETSYSAVTFEWSDGACTYDSECTPIEFGCGGGHIECTSNPAKWKEMMSTCEIVENHPSKQEFRCVCVEKEKKCGWVK